MTELLSCPFCGGKAHDVGPYGEGLFAVRCDQCGGGVSGFDQCRQDAIDAWNTRAAPIPQCDAGSVDVLRRQAFDLSPAEQYRLAFFIAENVGYVLTREPEHPDSPHDALVSPPSEAGREMVHRTSADASSPSGHPGSAPSDATHLRRPEYLTAWLFDRKSIMPIWLIEKYQSRPLPDDKIGHYATAVDGEFWRWFDPAKFDELFVSLPASAVEDNRTGEASAPLDIVNIKSSDQGTVAVSSAEGNTP